MCKLKLDENTLFGLKKSHPVSGKIKVRIFFKSKYLRYVIATSFNFFPFLLVHHLFFPIFVACGNIKLMLNYSAKFYFDAGRFLYSNKCMMLQ